MRDRQTDRALPAHKVYSLGDSTEVTTDYCLIPTPGDGETPLSVVTSASLTSCNDYINERSLTAVMITSMSGL